ADRDHEGPRAQGRRHRHQPPEGQFHGAGAHPPRHGLRPAARLLQRSVILRTPLRRLRTAAAGGAATHGYATEQRPLTRLRAARGPAALTQSPAATWIAAGLFLSDW